MIKTKFITIIHVICCLLSFKKFLLNQLKKRWDVKQFQKDNHNIEQNTAKIELCTRQVNENEFVVKYTLSFVLIIFCLCLLWFVLSHSIYYCWILYTTVPFFYNELDMLSFPILRYSLHERNRPQIHWFWSYNCSIIVICCIPYKETVFR